MLAEAALSLLAVADVAQNFSKVSQGTYSPNLLPAPAVVGSSNLVRT